MIGLLLLGFTLHFIADFLLQSRDMGKNKSSNPLVLAQHIGIQISVVFFGLSPFIGLEKAAFVSLLNGLIHGVIDWHIWRGYKYLAYRRLKKIADSDPRTTLEAQIKHFQYWEDHLFYTTIGLDQLLHISTLTIVIGVLV